MSDCSDFRVVVGLDFGTTFSVCYFEIYFIAFTLELLIKETVKSHWDGIASNDDDDDSSNNNDDVNYNDDDDDYVFNFLEKVLIIITVPAEYSEKDKGIMRECAHRAGLIKERESKNLQITTEPEAAAIYSISRGAALYGLSMINSAPNLDRMNSLKFVIEKRKLKYTYGIEISPDWEDGDPIERRDDGRIHKFLSMAQRGTMVNPNQEFTSNVMPVYENKKL
ncbi:unnamed protein product [Rhizophagus irregularis]|nr:unnamed protein product [Rhizophagus irregularis]